MALTGLTTGILTKAPGLGMLRNIGDGPIPTFWLDNTFDRRVVVSVQNTTGASLYDYPVTVALPAAPDANSLRVVEATSLKGIEHGYDWRYGNPVNRLPFLPVSVSGQNATFKTLGYWDNGQTRYFHFYWNSAGGKSALDFHHIDATPASWTATATAGTAGDVYALLVNGNTYSYTMIGGDTATTIAVALKNLINAGTDATATNSSGVLTIQPVNARSLTFSVTTAGTTTVPTNLVSSKPQYFKVARIGPDTENLVYSGAGLPFLAKGSAQFLAYGQSESATTLWLKLMRYKVNGDGNYYGAYDASINSINVGPTVDLAGNITFSTRSGGTDWSGTYTSSYQNQVAAMQKSDKTGGLHAINKTVDLVHTQVTFTCTRSHTPVAYTSGMSNYQLFEMATNPTFSGNTTTVAGEQLPYFYATGSTPTGYSSGVTDITGVTVNNTIMGQASNFQTLAYLVNNVSLSGFGANHPNVRTNFITVSNSTILQIINLTANPIPVGATITMDFWYLLSYFPIAVTTGANLCPSEAVAILRSLQATLTPVVGTVEKYVGGDLPGTLAVASANVVAGIDWLKTNSLAKTGKAGNYAFQYDTLANTVGLPDDDDGNYGNAHALHGLCLRYLRTHDTSLISKIESSVQFHLDIEAAAVATYSSWWNGSAPYWYWVSPTNSGSTYTSEGGISAGDTDPNFNGGVKGPITYTQGQVRALTSIDQMHMVAHGMYAYYYLLRNEPAITANATLRTNALNYISRMATFETAHWPLINRALPNLYAICSGGAPSEANGQTDATIPNPYRGVDFTQWQDSNTDNFAVAPSSNSTLDLFFQSVYAPNSTNGAVMRLMQGRTMDMIAGDLGWHDVTTSQTTWGYPNSVSYGTYPAGWGLHSATGQNYRYNAARTGGEKHYISLTAGGGGARDMATGREAQRAAVIALAALFDPSATIPIEMNGSTVVRSVNIVTALNAIMRTLTAFGTEPTTSAQKWTISYYYGGGGSSLVDSAHTGYFMMAVELWFLVQQRLAGNNLLPVYYKFSGV